jgi:hypothetical protein
MTWAEPIPEGSVVRVGGREGTIARINRGGESYDVAFGDSAFARTVQAREIEAVISTPAGSA